MDCRLKSAGPEEDTVFGACRPGYPGRNPDATVIDGWITRMKDRDISRVCCLLDTQQLEYYDRLLDRYRSAFGADQVTHAPVTDHTAVAVDVFTQRIYPALRTADQFDQRIVVHCSAGIGRTGQVLALWLALERDYSLDDAISTVRRRRRDPLEAISRAQLRETYHTIREGDTSPTA